MQYNHRSIIFISVLCAVLSMCRSEYKAMAAHLVPVYTASSKDLLLGTQSASRVTIDRAGNVIVAGTLHNSGNHDFLIIKYSQDLDYIKTVRFNQFRGDTIEDVTVDHENNIIMTGQSSELTPEKTIRTHYVTVKFDEDLNVLASVTYRHSTSKHAAATAVCTDLVGNIYVSGYDDDGIDADVVTIKYSPLLEELANARFDGSGADNDRARGIVFSQNCVFVAGESKNATPDMDFMVLKYDTDLNLINSTVYDSGGHESAEDIAVDASGNLYVAGYNHGGEAGMNVTPAPGKHLNYKTPEYRGEAPDVNSDFIIIKYNPSLVYQHLSRIEGFGSDDDYAYAITVDDSGNIYCAGMSDQDSGPNPEHSQYDYFMVKLTPDFEIYSSDVYDSGNDNLDVARGIIIDASGHIIVNGTAGSSTDPYIYTIAYLSGPSQPMIGTTGALPVYQGETNLVPVNGSDFFDGLTASISGLGLTVDDINRIDVNKIVIHVIADENAPLGYRDLQITNVDEMSTSKLSAIEVLPQRPPLENTGDIEVQGGGSGYVNPKLGERALIYFRPSEAGSVTVQIFTLRGSLVWETEYMATDTDREFVAWDCINESGNQISSGLYIVHVKGPGIDDTKKIAVLR
ncbi:MAG: hypothetical protein GF384_08170 [Elusimicrobia bacterium]|nr:hypothetical protein [Elusimicrobiota bacterium]MBD3412606.1 hypothetical protein [Elusimicrobiota bacterium]